MANDHGYWSADGNSYSYSPPARSCTELENLEFNMKYAIAVRARDGNPEPGDAELFELLQRKTEVRVERDLAWRKALGVR